LNFVTNPPLGWQAWSGLNLSLLTAVSVLEVAVLALYVSGQSRRILLLGLLVWSALSLSFWTLPAAWIYPVAEAGFIVFTLTGLVLLMAMVRQLRVQPDRLGWGLVLIYGLLIGLSVHDLHLHMSRASIAGGYLLIWLMPLLLMLMVALMMRHLDRQRSLENALERETLQREDLLRDLHDGIGSRLVALAFHARKRDGESALTDEIQALMRELHMIQGAVRTGPQTLAGTLADARHLYAQLGGGQLPLQWDIAQDGAGIALRAEQVIAVHRIIDEAIANALKHAQATRIHVQLHCPGDGPWAARLTIDNDGEGHFIERASGGLRNILLRAERAGLRLLAHEIGPLKRIEVLFARPAPTGWRERMARCWQGRSR